MCAESKSTCAATERTRPPRRLRRRTPARDATRGVVVARRARNASASDAAQGSVPGEGATAGEEASDEGQQDQSAEDRDNGGEEGVLPTQAASAIA